MVKKNNKKVIIEVINLKKDYKVGSVITKVLKGINMKIYEGEFVGIMGPSGSGKSTTLHQLALLDTPTEGKILVEGVDITKLSEIEKSNFRLYYFGYVFQEYRNIPELTALENVFLPLRMQGKPKKFYINEAKKLLEYVGLGNRLYHKPSELSGGQQQRVAIARALIHKPKILFADEPTASLDTGASKEILKLLKKYNEEYNQTIIMVTHETSHIKYFDRVVKIKDGLVEKK